MSSNKYEDCESCAFGGQNHAVCDECDDADQWEPGYEEDIKQSVLKFYPMMRNKMKVAA